MLLGSKPHDRRQISTAPLWVRMATLFQGRLSPWRIAEWVLPADFGEPAAKSGTAPPDHRVWACAERIIE
jgi:hypothetical protein